MTRLSRLDRFIGRMVSQRACIDSAVTLTKDMDGPILELGLGNGRTFDHIRDKFPDRDIYVFEQKVACHPSTIPTEKQLVLGDVFDTLPMMAERLGQTVSMVHTDLGGPSPKENLAFAAAISPLVEKMIAPGGVVIANDEMVFETLVRLDLPEGAMKDRAFFYQKPR